MFRGDLSRDGHPSTATLDSGAAARLAVAWRAGMAGAVDGSPAVSEGRVVAGSQGGRLAAYDASTGSRLWEVVGLGPIAGSPSIAGHRVFAGSLSGHVRAFGLARGERLWDWKAPGVAPAIWSSPAVYGSLLLVGVGSQFGDTPLEVGRMIALDVATGREAWATCAMAGCDPGGGIWSTPAVDAAGRAFVGVGNPVDGILAFSASSGSRLWTYSFYADAARDLDVGASPVLLDVAGREAVGVGSVAGVFKLLDASSGAVIWSDELVSGSPVHGLIASPGFDGTNLYVGSASAPTGMFALNPKGGGVIWRRQTDQAVYSSPAVGSGALVFGTGVVFGDLRSGSIIALASRDGHVLWSFDAHSAVHSSPAIAGNLVVVGDSNGDLFAFRPKS